MLGPRSDPHKESHHPKMCHFKPHNPFLVGLGTILIWFGWYAFNGKPTRDVQLATGPKLVADKMQVHPQQTYQFVRFTLSATPTWQRAAVA